MCETNGDHVPPNLSLRKVADPLDQSVPGPWTSDCKNGATKDLTNTALIDQFFYLQDHRGQLALEADDGSGIVRFGDIVQLLRFLEVLCQRPFAIYGLAG